MKYFVALVVLLACTLAAAQEKPGTITMRQLKAAPVMGDLGMPLGTVCEVEATVVANPSKAKGAPPYLLEVHAVNGVKTKQLLVEFSGDAKELPDNHFKLYEKIHGKRPAVLNDEIIQRLDREYAGSRYRLLVYETGSFSGTPVNLPKDYPVMADRGFHFSSTVVVVKRLQPEK